MASQRFPLFPLGDEQITLQPNKELIKELINPMNSSASLTILLSPSYRQNCGGRKTHQNSHLDFLCYSEIEKLCVPEGIFLQLAKTWSSLFCHRWRNCSFFELIEPNVICMLNRAYEGMEIYEKEKDMRDGEGKRGLRNQRGWKRKNWKWCLAKWRKISAGSWWSGQKTTKKLRNLASSGSFSTSVLLFVPLFSSPRSHARAGNVSASLTED